jgi:histone deacetylase 1/2
MKNAGSNSSVNTATRGGNGGNSFRGRNGGGHGGGRGNGRGGGRGGRGPNFQAGVVSQLCGKEGHAVVDCWKRFDQSWTGPPRKSMSSTTTSYGVDTNWYMDTGATDHVTGELEKLTTRDKYNGHEQVHTASGSGMNIHHVGSSVLHSPNSSTIHLKRILHVPSAQKSLVSVNRLTRDNDVYLEFHPDYFSIKDRDTRRTVLEGKCERGLYPLRVIENKQALSITKAPTSLWHSRLGHPAAPVVQRVLSHNQISFVKESNKGTVCDACQKGKSHALPYPKSFSTSSSPLQLVFSDVWGPAPSSVSSVSAFAPGVGFDN